MQSRLRSGHKLLASLEVKHCKGRIKEQKSGFLAGESKENRIALEGYGVTGISDIESILEHLRHSRPDLVLLDLYMKKRGLWLTYV